MSFYKLVELAFELSLSPQEWESKMLSQETQKRLGLRSPKLSKLLLKAGARDKVIQKVVSSSSPSYFSSSWEEQGDSIHFSSCQARDPRAKWFQNHTHSLYEVGDSDTAGMLLWVAGQPMSKDGKGFLARAKVRLCYGRGGILKGAFVDKIYGQSELLTVEALRKLLVEKFGHEVPVLVPPLFKLRGERVTIPSSQKGYQDSIFSGDAILREHKGCLGEALLYRLSVPMWARQEYKDWLNEEPPPKLREWRGKIEFPKKVKAFLGFPKATKVAYRYEDQYKVGALHLQGSEPCWTLGAFAGPILEKLPGELRVVSDYPALGLYKAVDI